MALVRGKQASYIHGVITQATDSLVKFDWQYLEKCLFGFVQIHISQCVTVRLKKLYKTALEDQGMRVVLCFHG